MFLITDVFLPVKTLFISQDLLIIHSHNTTWQLCLDLLASTASSIGNDSKIFESSTKESSLETCTIEGRSLVYREKRRDDRMWDTMSYRKGL